MDPALVIRRELPGDEEPIRALHDAAFGIPEGAEHSARDPDPGPAACRRATSSTR